MIRAAAVLAVALPTGTGTIALGEHPRAGDAPKTPCRDAGFVTP